MPNHTTLFNDHIVSRDMSNNIPPDGNELK